VYKIKLVRPIHPRQSLGILGEQVLFITLTLSVIILDMILKKCLETMCFQAFERWLDLSINMRSEGTDTFLARTQDLTAISVAQ